MKRTSLIPIVFGMACGWFAQAVLAGAERERQRRETLEQLEADMFGAAADAFRALQADVVRTTVQDPQEA